MCKMVLVVVFKFKYSFLFQLMDECMVLQIFNYVLNMGLDDLDILVVVVFEQIGRVQCSDFVWIGLKGVGSGSYKR